jgi:hypothetical protein
MLVTVNGATAVIVGPTEIEPIGGITATELTAITVIALTRTTAIAFTQLTVIASTVRTAFAARFDIEVKKPES